MTSIPTPHEYDAQRLVTPSKYLDIHTLKEKKIKYPQGNALFSYHSPLQDKEGFKKKNAGSKQLNKNTTTQSMVICRIK